MFYSLIKYILRIYLPLFFKKIHIEGFANVPKDQPILFAVNHQNTILDAVLTGMSLKKNTSFLVRADFFKNRLFNWFFDKLHLIPISRGQDKRGNLITFNQQTFSKCVTCLAQKKPILIFPEGTSSATHKLSKFKKGVARLAFQAESAHDFKLDLQVIPVTINYENHFKGQTEVWIKYGKPIIPS